MELLYIYIDSYRCFQKVEFNFRAEMRFQFDQGLRHIRQLPPCDKLFDGFWGMNIVNLNMVVGNNGAGKTSLMQFIIGMMTDVAYNMHTESLGRGIFIFQEKGELMLYDQFCGVKELLIYDTTMLEWRHIRKEELRERFSKYKIMLLNNALTRTDYQRGMNRSGGRYDFLYDCSVGNLVMADIKQDVNIELRSHSNTYGVGLDTYFAYEKYKQVKFVFDRNQNKILEDMQALKYPVPRPERLYIDLLVDDQLRHVSGISSDQAFLDVIREKNLFMEEYAQIEQRSSLWIHHESKETDRYFPYALLRYLLCRGCVYSAIRSIFRSMKSRQQDKFKDIFNNLLDTLKSEHADGCLTFYEINECLWNAYTRATDEKHNIEVSRIKSFYEKFLRGVQNVEMLSEHFRIETLDDSMLYPDMDRYSFSVLTTDSDWFIDFLQEYRYICNPDYFLDFSWGLSSGEDNLLSLFASFYYIFDKDFSSGQYGEPYFENKWEQTRLKTKCDSMLILIDEADLSYHLEWQKQFVSILTTFLQKVYPNDCCPNIQIIMSTHSPLLLSDVPEQNVIYLRYNADTRCVRVDTDHSIGTFGQNVHLLMRDSFFLESGTMGNFAERKINQLVKRLTNLKQEIESIEKTECLNEKPNFPQLLTNKKLHEQLIETKALANLIAEPIISRKLLDTIENLAKRLKPIDSTELNLEQYSKDDLLKLYERIGRKMNEQ